MKELEQLLRDELETVGSRQHPPVVDVLGLARAGRRERLRSWALAVTAATAAAAVIAGVAVATVGSSPGRDTTADVADRSDALTQQLTVTDRNLGPTDDTGQPNGSARWDPDDDALVYLSSMAGTGPCGVEGAATRTSGTSVRLVLTVTVVEGVPCEDSGQPTEFTITGLIEAPTDLVVTAYGGTSTVRVEQEQRAEARELDVSLVDQEFSEDSDLAPGSARGHEAERTVAYATTAVYNGCPPVAARASIAGSVLSLTLTDAVSIDPGFCAGFSASHAVFTISGLTEVPSELTVTEDGEARTVLLR